MLRPAHCVATTVAVLASTKPGLVETVKRALVRHVVHMVRTTCRCGASRHGHRPAGATRWRGACVRSRWHASRHCRGYKRATEITEDHRHYTKHARRHTLGRDLPALAEIGSFLCEKVSSEHESRQRARPLPRKNASAPASPSFLFIALRT